MNAKQQEYFQLRYINRITEFRKIADIKNIGIIESRKEYKSMDEFYMKELCISKDELSEIKVFFIEYHDLYRKYYNTHRKEIFKDPEKFVNWFHGQNKQCQYCGISEDELVEIVKIRNDNLTLNKKTKRSKGTIEIEKIDSNQEQYHFDNIILACPLCNNAKSNLIDDISWRNVFVKPMREYYESILNKKLNFNTPVWKY